MLERIDTYLAAWCARTARVERVGPFDVHVEPVPFAPKYARPVRGARIDGGHLDVLAATLRDLELPVEAEWVHELHPDASATARRQGWRVNEVPLLVLRGPIAPPQLPDDAVLKFVTADDPDLRLVHSIGGVAFARPGTAVGAEGIDELVAAARTDDASSVRARLARGDTTVAAVCVDGHPVATGGHQPDEPTSTTEIVGVCTLPAFRRRGFGLTLTATLAIDARERGLRDVWLSAASDDVAQLYGRVGFERVGTYVMAALELSGS